MNLENMYDRVGKIQEVCSVKYVGIMRTHQLFMLVGTILAKDFIAITS